jgi:Uma2 family endonuclease
MEAVLFWRRVPEVVVAPDTEALSDETAERVSRWDRARLSIDQFLALPELEDIKPALEFEGGRVTQKVSPKARHSGLQVELTYLFDRASRRRKVARAFSELRVTFGGRSYVPDVSVLLWDRIPRDERGMLLDDVLVAPDIAVEIVSPGQSVNALVRRCLTYVSLDVRVALLVDPTDESVIVFRAGQSAQALRGTDEINLEDVLPGFAVTVARVFKALRIN